jgi:hypothetical protein
MVKKTFEDAQTQLAEKWGPKLSSANGDQACGAIIRDFIIERERLRYGTTGPGEDRDWVDAKTMEKMENPNQLGPEHAALEVVLRRLVNNPASAFGYFEEAVETKKHAQSRRARKPRPRSKDSITRLIEEIIEDKPKLTAKAIGRELEKRPDTNIVGDEYRHSDGSTIKISNLSSRVSDAKKRVSG